MDNQTMEDPFGDDSQSHDKAAMAFAGPGRAGWPRATALQGAVQAVGARSTPSDLWTSPPRYKTSSAPGMPQEQAGPKESDGEVFWGDVQISTDGLAARSFELAFEERVDQVSGNLRQALSERLPKLTTFVLTERIAAPVERRDAPAAATVEHAVGPVPGPHVFPRALLAADLPDVVGDLMFEDGDEPGADRRPTGIRMADPEGREECLLHQVGGGLRILHPRDGKPEEAVPVLIDPRFGVEGRCIVHRLKPL